MKYRYGLEEKKERRLWFVRLVRRLAIFGLVFIMFYTLFLYTGGRPHISEESLKALSFIPLEKTYQLESSKDIKEVRLYAEQEGQRKELYGAKLPEPSRVVSFVLKPREAGLKDGVTKLFLEVSSGPLLKRTYELQATVDTVPPRLNIIAYTQYTQLGGSFAIKVKTEDGALVSLFHGEHVYSLYPLGDGYYFGIVPVRLDGGEIQSFRVEASDTAGNKSSQNIHLKVKQVRFKEDHISIGDSFVSKVIYPLLGKEGSGLTPLEAFKRVNEVWRARDIRRIEEMGKKSEPKVLWDGAFLQLPNSKVFAGYGEIRHYFYEGQKVSESRHMGFDFASLERTPVPAGNSGLVVFAGDLGIYGNTVIIDHGMGLMSLYGHLSEIRVKEGQFVKKGESIGRSGATGLALGDHLHFGILVQGYETNPIEWLDPKWIKNNILAVLEAR